MTVNGLILCVNLTGPRQAQRSSYTLFGSVSVRAFLKKISIRIGGLSKADGSPHCGEGMNGKSRGMVNSLNLTSE